MSFTRLMRDWLLPDTVCQRIAKLDPADFLASSEVVSWWVAGIAVLADWIGSNTEVFNYLNDPEADIATYWLEAQAKAHRALALTGVVMPARQKLLSSSDLFPGIAKLSPLQLWTDQQALETGPQLHILEDVTGAGKTEAAMILTHRLMANGSADGFFLGLPSMATANAMYGRLAEFYQVLFGSDASLALMHGQRTLVEAFANSIIRTGPAEHDKRQGDESATQRCLSWLADHNKRSLLCPAGVGTIDQALLAVLQSKHQSLRLLGLARKVLVVDEVHACDSYMQGTLENLLTFHARAGGSAILMSATLPMASRTALLNAFAKGAQAQTQAPTKTRAPEPALDAFPLATTWAASQPQRLVEQAIATRESVRRTLGLRYFSDRSLLVQEIVAALKRGQCVAWIRNTVADALDAQAELSTYVDLETITLFHARFALGDRLDIEDEVLKKFGNESTPALRRGQLLIATQVVEQSLDIDVDWLVSDIAPIDRVLQRAGRLRRHVRTAAGERLTYPGATDERGPACLWVYGPVWTEQPSVSWLKDALPKASFVYPNHAQVWLSAKALQASEISMPDDARKLIEGVFGSDIDEPEGLTLSSTKALGKHYSDVSQARMNGIKQGSGYTRTNFDWTADSVAPSRLGEESVEVLLGVWHGDELQPLRQDKVAHPWAYSTLRVARRLINEADPEVRPARSAAIEAIKAGLPSGGKWLVLLPMEPTPSGFSASAIGAPSTNGQPTKSAVLWHYSRTTGLLLAKQVT